MNTSEDDIPVLEAIDSFGSMNLDPRLIKALYDLKWKKPTPIQSSALPLALSGKDLLIQATTGSGKTAVFLLPILHGLLKSKELGKTNTGYPYAVILSPNKELAEQTAKFCRSLCKHCRNLINCVVLDPEDINRKVFSIFELRVPDILISTPSLIKKCLQNYSPKLLRKARVFVADEADLLFRFGYREEMRAVIEHMKGFQSIVVSATLSKESYIFKTLLPKNLAIVRLMNQELPDKDQLKQFYINVKDNAKKFAVLVALFNFNIIKGNCLIFCNTSKTAYKVKLFLDCFKHSSRVLNENLPFNSRQNTIDEFNAGQFRIIIATDSGFKPFNEDMHADIEYSVSRGMDFCDLPVVINFNLPEEEELYIHRAGRTARGVKKGSVLSFVGDTRWEKRFFKSLQYGVGERTGSGLISVLSQMWKQPKGKGWRGKFKRLDVQLRSLVFNLVAKILTSRQMKIQKRLSVGSEESVIEMYPLDIHTAVEGLFYRVNTVMQSISRKAVINAERHDLKREIMRSKKLQFVFKRNPVDFEAVRKWNPGVNHLQGIEDLPKYLRPASLPDYVRVAVKLGDQNETENKYDQDNEDEQDHDRGSSSARRAGSRKRKNMSTEMNDYYKAVGLMQVGSKKKTKSENDFKAKKAKRDIENSFKNKKPKPFRKKENNVHQN